MTKPSWQLFVDLDGVLADFDSYYAETFGVRPDRITEPPDFWRNLSQHAGFFRALPVLPDAHVLWAGVKQFHPNPIVLTGVPYSVPDASAQKIAWLAEHFPDAPMIAAASHEKRQHGKPGDILIDDWTKYRHLWEAMGGTFIVHTSAEDSLRQLQLLTEKTA